MRQRLDPQRVFFNEFLDELFAGYGSGGGGDDSDRAAAAAAGSPTEDKARS